MSASFHRLSAWWHVLLKNETGSASPRAVCSVFGDFWRATDRQAPEYGDRCLPPMKQSDVISTLTECRKAVELTFHEITFRRRLRGTIG